MSGGEVLAYAGLLTVSFTGVLALWLGMWSLIAIPFVLLTLIAALDRAGHA